MLTVHVLDVVCFMSIGKLMIHGQGGTVNWVSLIQGIWKGPKGGVEVVHSHASFKTASLPCRQTLGVPAGGPVNLNMNTDVRATGL